MKLYMIRHGESECNCDGCYTGWADVSLTEKGKFQAGQIAPILERVAFDKVYCSDLVRAEQTARNAILGCDPQKTALLREYCLGSLEGKRIADCKREGGEAFERLFSAYDFTSYGGEDLAGMQKRLGEFLEMLCASGYSNVAAFTHGGVLRTMLAQVLGVGVDALWVSCTNCTVGVFEWKNERWRLSGWINPQDFSLEEDFDEE